MIQGLGHLMDVFTMVHKRASAHASNTDKQEESTEVIKLAFRNCN